MKQCKKRYVIGLMSFALLFSVISVESVFAQEQLLDHVTTAKVVGDRFSILDFNDIWKYIKGMFMNGDRIGMGAAPRTVDTNDVTFDLGGSGTPGILATDKICDDATCTDTEDILNEVERGGVGRFVGVTDGDTYTTITGASGTSSLDVTGKTKGSITYQADGGPALTGYKAANAICQVDTGDLRAHVCSEDEIVLTIRSNPTAFDPFTVVTQAWVTGGGAKYVATELVNDCNGFKYNAGSGSPHYVGNIWKLTTDGGSGSAQPCITFTKISCCI